MGDLIESLNRQPTSLPKPQKTIVPPTPLGTITKPTSSILPEFLLNIPHNFLVVKVQCMRCLKKTKLHCMFCRTGDYMVLGNPFVLAPDKLYLGPLGGTAAWEKCTKKRFLPRLVSFVTIGIAGLDCTTNSGSRSI
jgi:hypothetical protein